MVAPSTRTIPEPVLAVLGRAICFNNTLKLPNQLERPLYVEVNKVLEALGGTWQRRAKAHVFDADAQERIDQAILTGSYERANQLEFFRTPPDLARQVVALADLRAGQIILEPSAGDGALLDAIDAVVGDMLTCVHCCEIDVSRRAILERRGADLVGSDFLCYHGTVRRGDVLIGPWRYDRIVMNPPFSRGRDVAHVTHACTLLAPGGRLVAIMSAGVRFREDSRYRTFREFVQASGGRITDNPPDAFAASGTSVRTVTVVLGKPPKE